ncbi:hypothetical protein ACAN107058_19800 [Paracidovorax anthurii]
MPRQLEGRAGGVLDRFGAVLHQVDEHLLDEDGVGHHGRQARGHVVGQAHVVAAQFDVGQFHRLAHHALHVGQGAVGLALFHEGADALDDLAGALGLVGRLLQRGEQRLLGDLLALDARDHAAAVVADGGERLVELVRHAGGHLAHGDEAAHRLRALGLPGGLFLGLAARGDVGGDHHLREAPVHPVEVARAHLQPLAEVGQVDLGVLGARVGEGVGGQAHERVLVVHAARAGGAGGQHAGLGDELQVAAGLRAEPLAVELVGEEQLLAAQRRHRDRGIERFQHDGEALVRGGELLAHAVGLGDVGHRGHPAGLLAVGVDEGRDIEARVEQGAVPAPDPHLEAAHGLLAAQLVAQLGVQGLVLVLGPVGVGRRLADQLLGAPAGHLAEGRVHVRHAAVHVERAHAGDHGVLHRAAEVGLGHERFLGAQAPPRVAPVGDEHPGRHGAEGAHQPEQAAAHHAERGAIGLRAQHEAVAHGRDEHLVLVRARGPGQQVGGPAPGGERRAGQQLLLAVQHGDRVARQHLGGRAVAQQAVHRVFGQHHAREAALRHQRHLQLQQRRGLAVARAGERLRIDGLLQVARDAEGVGRVAALEHLAGHAQLAAGHGGRRVAGADAAAIVDPGDGLQLGVLADEPFRAGDEVGALQVLVREIACDTHDLLLPLQQAQAHPLLGVLHVAPQGLLFALGLLGAQVPERRHDGGEEHQHGGERGQGREAVLPGGREAAPPGAPPAGGRDHHGRLRGNGGRGGGVVHAASVGEGPGGLVSPLPGLCAVAAFFHIVVLLGAI